MFETEMADMRKRIRRELVVEMQIKRKEERKRFWKDVYISVASCPNSAGEMADLALKLFDAKFPSKGTRDEPE